MKKSKIALPILFVMAQIMCIEPQMVKGKALDFEEINLGDFAGSAAETANYVLNHLDEWNEERAKAGYLTAVTSAEISEITVDMFGQETVQGYLLDFDGSKGYIIVGPEMTFYDYCHEYNPPYNAFTSGTKFYDEKEGFGYIDDFGNRVILGLPGNQVNDVPPNDVLYDGQHLRGEYTIYDTDAYVLSRYGEQWDPVLNISIFDQGNMVGHNYYEMMIYYDLVDEDAKRAYGPSLDEYLSALSIVEYIGWAKGVTGFGISQKINYLASQSEPDLYNDKISHYYTARVVKMNSAQRAYRKYVLDNYDDDADLTREELLEIIPGIFADKGVTVETHDMNGVSVLMKIHKQEFTYNRPILIITPDSFTYGDHFAAVCGYKTYEYVKYILGIKKTVRKFFLETKDSIAYAESTYFDLYAYAGVDSYTYTFSY